MRRLTIGTKNAERRCKSCKKLLLDEIIPLCRRCRLAHRNTAVQFGEVVSGLAIASTDAIAYVKSKKTDISSSKDENNEEIGEKTVESEEH